MMLERLIDAIALMKRVCEKECGPHFDINLCDLDDDSTDTRCVFRDYVRAAPTIEAEPWIPCSERMPESRAVVIFTVNRGYPFVCVGYRINSERDGLKLQRWFCKLSKLNFSDYDVTAWMPMPDAYEPPESEAQKDAETD